MTKFNQAHGENFYSYKLNTGNTKRLSLVSKSVAFALLQKSNSVTVAKKIISSCTAVASSCSSFVTSYRILRYSTFACEYSDLPSPYRSQADRPIRVGNVT